jgi:hypothetical protein
MAVNDFVVYRSAHGGHETVRWGPMNASEVFDRGEVVFADPASGEITEAQGDGTEITLAEGMSHGVAIFGPAGGSETNDRDAQINPDTGVEFTTGDRIAFIPFNEGVLFATDNFLATGAEATGTLAVPAASDIGNAYEIVYSDGGTPDRGWCVEQTAATTGTDWQAVIVDVLDADGVSLIEPNAGTGTTVVFDVVS